VFPFGFAIFHHRLHNALAFERTAQAANEFRGDGFDEDAFRRGFYISPRAFSISNSFRRRRGMTTWPLTEK